MTLKVIGSDEVVVAAYWLDLRSRTAGVKVFNPATNGTRCCELSLAGFYLPVRLAGTCVDVELVLGDMAFEIFRDE